MIENKMMKSIQNLKPSVEYTKDGDGITENDFKKIMWTIGVSSNGLAITTTTNPHPEITWPLVKAEMDKL
jgi:hypothetical protein|tara:strand:+ start:433 stop:642 length:210 start_codon:yes stop_codon:yes gene_type:complete